MVILEKRARRIELALYVLSHAVLSFYNHWRARGYLPYFQNAEIFIFSLSLAILMHSYINHPLLLRKTYFGLFRFAFGSGAALLGFPDKQRRLSIVTEEEPDSGDELNERK